MIDKYSYSYMHFWPNFKQKLQELVPLGNTSATSPSSSNTMQSHFLSLHLLHLSFVSLLRAQRPPILASPNTYKPFTFCSPHEYLTQGFLNIASLSPAVSTLGLFLLEEPSWLELDTAAERGTIPAFTSSRTATLPSRKATLSSSNRSRCS